MFVVDHDLKKVLEITQLQDWERFSAIGQKVCFMVIPHKVRFSG